MRVFLKRLVLTVWLGMIWSVGYLAAPILFETLDDRALAGLVAGKLFTTVAWVSLVAGPIMAFLIMATGERSRRRSLKLICVLLVMLSMVSVHWIFTPMMEGARLPDGTPGESFLMIHGASSVVYLLGSLIGLVLLWPGKIDLRIRKGA
ncbi:MAG: DUF4149 domain-containing protein [Gammaproteobacteria bacterium]|jgi:hypothetical protein|nr:DUF4149 domain-containing protein [Gammaproteobacteria bacterium]